MVNIFVEGTTDVKLLFDFVLFHFNHKINIETVFVKTGGHGGLFNNDSLIRLRQGTDNEDYNIVIFDADNDCEARRQEIIDKAISHAVDLALFLYPNNKEAGEREDFLTMIANPEKFKPFHNCFAPYATCILAYKAEYDAAFPSSKLKPFVDKASKTAIHNYLHMHGDISKEHNINYTNPDFWLINSPAVEPLRKFLAPYFS